METPVWVAKTHTFTKELQLILKNVLTETLTRLASLISSAWDSLYHGRGFEPHLCDFLFFHHKHWWFSGEILVCHVGGPSLIPGQCKSLSVKCPHSGTTKGLMEWMCPHICWFYRIVVCVTCLNGKQVTQTATINTLMYCNFSFSSSISLLFLAMSSWILLFSCRGMSKILFLQSRTVVFVYVF